MRGSTCIEMAVRALLINTALLVANTNRVPRSKINLDRRSAIAAPCLPSHETFRGTLRWSQRAHYGVSCPPHPWSPERRSDKNGTMRRSVADVGVVVAAASGGGDSYEDPWGPYGAPWYNVGNLIFRVINKRMRLCPPHKKLPAGQRARRPRFS